MHFILHFLLIQDVFSAMSYNKSGKLQKVVGSNIYAHFTVPVIFFTVQKSIDNRITITTKLAIKLSLNHPHRRYATMADTLKSIWKNTATGCLKKVHLIF